MSVFDDIVSSGFIGENLEQIVNTFGEVVYFTDEDGYQQYQKATLNHDVSKNEISADNVYKFIGEMTFPDRLSMETYRGSYFKREKLPDKSYILISTTENPFSDKYANVEVVECNKVISIGNKTSVLNKETGNYDTVFQPIFENIPAFADTSDKAPRETQIGSVPTSITTITVPCEYVTTTANTIIMKEFKQIYGKTLGQYSEQYYDVIFVDETFMNTFDETTFFGVLKIDVVKDL